MSGETEKTIKTEELIDTLTGALKEARERSEKLEKRFDSLDLEALNKAQEDVGKVSKQLSDVANEMKEKENESKKEIEELKKQQAVLSAATGSSKTNEEKNKEENEIVERDFNHMLRSSTGYAEYQKHSAKSIDGLVEKHFKYATDDEKALARKSLSTGSNPGGGYVVTADFGGMVGERSIRTSPLRPYASVITSESDRIEFVLDDNEADSGWVGETQNRPNTGTPSLGQIIIAAHEVYAQPLATQKMLDDAAINIPAWLAGHVSRRFTRDENKAFVSGDGANQPKGFLSYDGWSAKGVYERGKIEEVNSGSATAVDGNSFKKLKGALNQEYNSSAIWGMNQATWTEVTQLKDGNQRYLFDMNTNFRDGDQLRLLGQQVVLMDDMPDVAANSKAVVYGNFSDGYLIVDRIGIRVLRDEFTSKPHVKFYTTKRVGGAVINYEALKIMTIGA